MASEHSAVSFSALVGAYKDPHRLYDAARSRDGVFYDAAGKCWLVTDHAAVRSVLGDSRFTSELPGVSAHAGKPVPFVQAAIQRQILFTDGEQHLRVQQVILRESAQKMKEVLPTVKQRAHELLEAGRARGKIDLVKEFAVPYSMEAICLVLGVPMVDKATLDQLTQWSTSYANVTSGYLMVRMQEITLLGDYFRALLTRRERGASNDLIEALSREGIFESDDDLIVNCMMAFAAGRVTTQKLLSDGIPALLPRWSEWRAQVRGNPRNNRRVTDELLRFVTPTRYLARYAKEDVHVSSESGGDHLVRRGDKVFLFLEAANRDATTFPDPHQLIPERQPNPHIAFGYGSHACPGAGIARLEIQTALEALFDTFAELRPDPSVPPTWDPNANIGGYTSFVCTCA